MDGRYPILAAGGRHETKRPFALQSPADRSFLGTTFFPDEGLLERALAALAAAFPSFREEPAHRRAAWCLTVSRKLEERREEFARLIALEAAKPLTDARREVDRAVLTFEDGAAEARRGGFEALPLDVFPGAEGRFGLVRRFPVGPLFAITPFNFPLNLAAHKVAPALACGAPFLLKPSPRTPLTALRLGEVLLEAGVPPEAFAVFPADNAQAERILLDARVRALSFTGSAPVGWHLKSLVPRKKVLLELGGTAGVAVEPDADLAFAAARCTAGSFGYAGQTCISVQRILVHESIAKEFLERFLEAAAGLRRGDVLDPETRLGPMIDEEAARRAEAWVKEALDGGARLLLGGRREGSFLEATVLEDVPRHCRLSCEEVFAPVVAVERYADFEEALTRLNDGPFGLQAGIFTRDLSRADRAFRSLEVGAVVLNDVPTWRVDPMPYGGVKDSGFGREGVRYAVEELTERRLLAVNPS